METKSLMADALKAGMNPQTFWLIEWPATEATKSASWWKGRGFTDNANEAIQFRRKRDAEACLLGGDHFGTIGRMLTTTEHSYV